MTVAKVLTEVQGCSDNHYMTLPRIIQFIERTDAGEYGADSCAHCGAKCRYQQVFMGDDGMRHSAAAGCIRLYRVSPVAAEHAKIDERRTERNRDGRTLASWDLKKLEAIEKFYADEIDEQACIRVIEDENARRSAWMRKRR